jgi:hypothetical protein
MEAHLYTYTVACIKTSGKIKIDNIYHSSNVCSLTRAHSTDDGLAHKALDLYVQLENIQYE